MKLRVFSLVLAVCLAIVPALAGASSSEDYSNIYETAVQLAGNDLTNIDHLNHAVSLLEQLGSHMFAKMYIRYFQQIVAIQSDNPQLDQAEATLKLQADAALFTKDLAERGFPSCKQLLTYIEGRKLEAAGNGIAAGEIYRKLTILDAQDRAIKLIGEAKTAEAEAPQEAQPAIPETPANTEEPKKIEFTEAEINNDHFPDKAFRNIVSRFDQDNDKKLSAKELKSVTYIDCKGQKIKSLKGIEYFLALEELDCSGNDLNELDISANTALQWLNCNRNQLSYIYVGNNLKLRYLDTFDNKLTNLDLTRNTELTEVRTSYNHLTSLDISKNKKLETLWCNNNNLQYLDTKENKMLCSLECGANQITVLDLSSNPSLERLKCNGNGIASLDVSRCEKLIEAITKGTVSEDPEGRTLLFKVPERNKQTDSENTIRDPNCYVIVSDTSTTLVY